MKRFIIFALTLSMILAIPTVAAEAGSLEHFSQQNTFSSDTFTDVTEAHYFYDNVSTAYELGLMTGQSSSTFGIDASITRLETLILACRLHNIYYAVSDGIVVNDRSEAESIYLAYATEYGIFTDLSDWSVAASRNEFAAILSSAFPDSALEAINSIEDGCIPDVSMDDTYASAIYRLYRAGILTGSDTSGTFYGDTQITRGAAAAIVTRMADSTLRKELTLTIQANLSTCACCDSQSSCTAHSAGNATVLLCNDCYAELQATAEGYMPYLEALSKYYDQFALYDLNKDGIPELISEEGCYIYSYSTLRKSVWKLYESYIIVSIYASPETTEVVAYYGSHSNGYAFFEYYNCNENGGLTNVSFDSNSDDPDEFDAQFNTLIADMELIETNYTIDDVNSLLVDIMNAVTGN